MKKSNLSSYTSLFFAATLLLTQTTIASDELSEFEAAHMAESMTSSFYYGMPNPNTIVDSNLEVFSRRSFFKFEEVISHLHESVENEADIIYLVNTYDKSTSCKNNDIYSIPSQHLMILKRESSKQSLFQRNQSGQISSFNPNGVQFASLSVDKNRINYKVMPEFKSLSQLSNISDTTYVPISSGLYSGKKIQSFSGIFRINEVRTNSHRKSTNTISDPMQYSVYINAEYDDGKESGLALHGTSQNFWNLLGKQRASSGCIRLQSDLSRWNQNLLFAKSSDGQLVGRPELSDSIHVWNRRDLYPPDQKSYSALMKAKKLKVLVIMFDGYKTQCL